MKKKVLLITVIISLLLSSLPVFAAPVSKLDFKERHTFEEIENELERLSKDYPEYTKLFSIGSSWRENEIWCLKITNKKIADEKKTGIAIMANIHGGEQESAESALYSAIKFCEESSTAEGKKILDGYVIYIVPVINPDGYIQSFIYNTRPNLKPTDLNGDGVVFSDPYTDINGDGVIAEVYKGKVDTKLKEREKIGMESPDWDKNGILGDDPKTSGIDLNRTFKYQYARYDIETDPKFNKDSAGVVGNNSYKTNGKAEAGGREPEVKAVERFFAKYPVDAMTTIHTGIQTVLYPWCYRAYEPENPKDVQIPHMKETSEKMAKKFSEITGRDFYAKQSYDDYTTSAELIDYTFGRHKINSYTIEVYRPGMSDPKSEYIEDRCAWNDKLPEETWIFYNKEDIKSKLNLDYENLGLKDGEGLWFKNTSRAQMAGKAPEDQDVMVKGCFEIIKLMIESEEPNGNNNYFCPEYLQ